ncbi:M48 family metallopeptidase [Pyruvatibacter sp.]|uniref:M48 family metallopeptidase n=1 Tax=Pyruvatibacter sp. TaxID=1981328 RepID=UPI0032ECA3F8
MNKALTSTGAVLPTTIEVAGREVPVVLRANKRARRMILKVDPVAREVTITSPTARGFAKALTFARQHESWIAERLDALPDPVPFADGAIVPVRGIGHQITHDASGKARAPVRAEAHCMNTEPDLPLFAQDNVAPRLIVSGDKAHISRRVADWLKREARHDLTQATLAHAAAFGTAPARITLRDTASRWGSCSTSRVINYSWRLIFAPPYALDYVAAHEAAHLIEHNHGPRFWALVRTRIDDIDRAKIWLTENGAALHRFGAASI